MPDVPVSLEGSLKIYPARYVNRGAPRKRGFFMSIEKNWLLINQYKVNFHLNKNTFNSFIVLTISTLNY